MKFMKEGAGIMLNGYAEKRYEKAQRATAIRHILICPYCSKTVTRNEDAEYIKTKQGIEHFFHRSCLAAEIAKYYRPEK